MLSDNDAKAEFGLSEAELAEMEASADSYDEGVWPEGRVQVMGRPACTGFGCSRSPIATPPTRWLSWISERRACP